MAHSYNCWVHLATPYFVYTCAKGVVIGPYSNCFWCLSRGEKSILSFICIFSPLPPSWYPTPSLSSFNPSPPNFFSLPLPFHHSSSSQLCPFTFQPPPTLLSLLHQLLWGTFIFPLIRVQRNRIYDTTKSIYTFLLKKR